MANNTSRTWRPTKGREIQDITDKINRLIDTAPTTIIEKGSSGTGIVGVASFNGRTGAVVPQSGDYTAAMVGLSNVTNDAQLKISQLDTDGTLSADSDTRVASQKATKTYVDNKIWNIDGGSASSIYLASQILDGGGA